MKKKIDLTSCVGSETLCYFWDCDNTIDDSVMGYGYLRQILRLDFGLLLYETQTEGGYRYDSCKIAENIWQSTASKLVIPDGLVCDVQYVTGWLGKCADIVSHQSLFLDRGQLRMKSGVENSFEVAAIKVTGVADGWEY